MKNRYLLALAVMILTLSSATAQRNRAFRSGNCLSNNPNAPCLADNLTDEQQQQMDAERVRFQKEIQADKNKLGELRARKRTLETTEPIDTKSLDNVIAEINTINAGMQKSRVRHQQAIKAFLTDDQVVAFDSFRGTKSNSQFQGRKAQSPQCQYKGQGNRGGRGQGQGNRNDYGKGNGHGEGRGNGQGNRANNTPRGMSDELRTSLNEARMELLTKEQSVTNKLNELDAQIQTLTTGKNIDYKVVDKLIDERASLQLELTRLRNNHRQKVRNSLSDEDKVWFDNRPMKNRGNHRPY